MSTPIALRGVTASRDSGVNALRIELESSGSRSVQGSLCKVACQYDRDWNSCLNSCPLHFCLGLVHWNGGVALLVISCSKVRRREESDRGAFQGGDEYVLQVDTGLAFERAVSEFMFSADPG
jgi:hypothetical protein